MYRMLLAGMPPGWAASRELCRGRCPPAIETLACPLQCTSAKVCAQDCQMSSTQTVSMDTFCCLCLQQSSSSSVSQLQVLQLWSSQPQAEAVLPQQAAAQVVFEISLWYWAAPSPPKPALWHFHFLFMVVDVPFSHSHWKGLCYVLKCNPHSQPRSLAVSKSWWAKSGCCNWCSWKVIWEKNNSVTSRWSEAQEYQNPGLGWLHAGLCFSA